MNRHVAAVGAFVVLLLVAALAAGCGGQASQAQADDPTAGNRAELVTLGGARLDPQREQQVTVRVSAGEVRIVAEVTGTAPALDCDLQRLDGDSAQQAPVALSVRSRTASDGTIFTLSSSALEAGTYRLTYTGRGQLKYLGLGANYR